MASALPPSFCSAPPITEHAQSGTLEKPVRDQGGRESNLVPHNNLPPLVPLTGETACPTKTKSLHFMTVRADRKAHREGADAEAPDHWRSQMHTLSWIS